MLIGIIIIFIIIMIIYALSKSADRQAEEARRKQAQFLAKRHKEIIDQSLEIISKTKNLSTLVSRLDTIIENADKLIKIAEDYNYPDLTEPPPQELKNNFVNYKENKIKEFLLDQVNYEIEKAQAITKKSSKITILDKAILFILDAKRLINDAETKKILEDKESEIRQLIENIQNS